MLILVDGYNATMHDPGLVGCTKEAQRDALLGVVRNRATRLHGRGVRAVVVFDAHGMWGRSAEQTAGVTAVYATDADDEIVRRCEAVRGAVVVYTDDMRLRARISQDVGRRVEYRDVSALHVGAAATPNRPVRRTPRAEDELPADATDITAELAQEWLADEE